MDERLVNVGIGVFVFKDGKFLMLKRRGAHGARTWSIPGGKMQFGESFEETVRREVKEETGLEVKNIRFGAVTNDHFANEDKHFVSVWMLCDWKSGTPKVLEPEFSSDMHWNTFDEMPKDNLFAPWYQLKKTDFFKHIRKLA